MTKKKNKSAKPSGDAGDGRPAAAPGEEPHKIKNKLYRKELKRLQIELVKLQEYFTKGHESAPPT